MRILRGLSSTAAVARPACALTIGNFDGVHRGHQALLARLRAQAAARGLSAAVLSFEPHPREWFAARRAGAGQVVPAAPARVSTLRDRLSALAACGVDATCVLRFDAALAAMPATRFVEDVLVRGLSVRHLLVGDDFRFGAGRTGDFALLQAEGARLGFSVERMDTVAEHGERLSSTALREALAAGDFPRAERLLGRPYAMSGRVVHGRKLGRELGFPTLNLRLWRHDAARRAARPAVAGIFVVRVHGLASGPLPGVASLGTRPAVESNGDWLLETHLLDVSGNFYGRSIRVEFTHKLRDEAHYDTLDALVAQIALDTQAARRWHAAHPAS